jgi:hypothetical protein
MEPNEVISETKVSSIACDFAQALVQVPCPHSAVPEMVFRFNVYKTITTGILINDSIVQISDNNWQDANGTSHSLTRWQRHLKEHAVPVLDRYGR